MKMRSESVALATLLFISLSAEAQVCNIKNFDAVGPHTSSPVECGVTGCAYYLETRYADCAEFCEDNGLVCSSSRAVLDSADTCHGEQIETSCYRDAGIASDQYPRICTCAGVCHIDDFSAVGENSFEQCGESGCNWYLETDHADCDDFCSDNGLAALDAKATKLGAGCSATPAELKPLNTFGDGDDSSRFARTCECGCADPNAMVVAHDSCPSHGVSLGGQCMCASSTLAAVRCCANDGAICVTPTGDKGDCAAVASVRSCAKDNDGSTCGTPTGDKGDCATPATFEDAHQICADLKMRLCSVDELESDICCDGGSAGCGHDNERVWTEDVAPCATGCDITDFSVVGDNTRSPTMCKSSDSPSKFGEVDGCRWHLETDSASCDEFCESNGLTCVDAEEVSNDCCDACANTARCVSWTHHDRRCHMFDTSQPFVLPGMSCAGLDPCTSGIRDGCSGTPTGSITCATVGPNDYSRTCTCAPFVVPPYSAAESSNSKSVQSHDFDLLQLETEAPSPAPTEFPSPAPTEFPSPAPTEFPSPAPTEFPSPAPTEFPSPAPTEFPSPAPTEFPSPAPTEFPSPAPTEFPSPSPTEFPTPTPTVEPSDTVYTFTATTVTYATAQTACRNAGGDLASIHSAAEEDALRDFVNDLANPPSRYWVGFSDDDNNAATDPVWSDGTAWNFVANWGVFHPQAGECGIFNSGTDPFWWDLSCTSNVAYVCQFTS